MQKKYLNFSALFLGAICTLIFSFSCTKVNVGHLDPYLYYPQNPMTIQQGRPFMSFGLNPNGSTRPMHVELLHIYNKATGQIVDQEFQQKFPLKIWTAAYDHALDTTLDMVNVIRKTVDTPALWVDPVSGALIANFNTYQLDTGDFIFDVRISNVYGSKIYPKLGEFKLVYAPPYQKDPEIGSPYDKLYKVGNESVVKSAKNPIISISRITDTPDVIIVKFIDKNGIPFNPKAGEIIKRPYPGNNPPQPYLQTMDDYAIMHTYSDTAMNFYYPVVPFPLVSLGNGFNYYYRIPAQYAHVDGFPDSTYSLNPRFVARFFLPGKYEVTILLPDVTHL